jgi:flavodoxin
MQIKNVVKVITLIMIVICHLTSSSGNAQSDTSKTKQPAMGNKILIVYLSRTGNTKALAEIIQRSVGGELIAIELVHPYPDNYKQTVDQSSKELKEGFLPQLKTRVDSIEKYDIIFIGFPTWDMQLPPPVQSFLKQYNLSGKAVIPFNTNAGYGVGSSFNKVKQLCPNSKVLEGYSAIGGIERDGVLFVMEGEKEKQVEDEVAKWLEKIKPIWRSNNLKK